MAIGSTIRNCLKWSWIEMNSYKMGAFKFLQELILERHRSLEELEVLKIPKNVVITGGSRGIGLETVTVLLRLNYNVIVGCREVEKCKSSINSYLKSLKDERCETDGSFEHLAHGGVEVIPLDLSDLASVRSFAKTITEKRIKISLLINNAGIMFGPHKLTKDGFESQMQINYLSHFLLTHLLIPCLSHDNAETGDDDTPSINRVINVSSRAHEVGRWMQLEDENKVDFKYEDFYSASSCYGESKAALIMMNAYLSRKFPNITFLSLHPGVVSTELFSNSKFVWFTAGFLMKSPRKGADTTIYACLAPDLHNNSGSYLENCKCVDPHSFCSNEVNQEKMFKVTCRLLNINEFGST